MIPEELFVSSVNCLWKEAAITNCIFVLLEAFGSITMQISVVGYDEHTVLYLRAVALLFEMK